MEELFNAFTIKMPGLAVLMFNEHTETSLGMGPANPSEDSRTFPVLWRW
ncbi:MAG: hypothetical protein BMS9Abin01_2508 [Gammaproteobacteria bacterium]|nr:MAG: hypothetical protein BMS9Abin01_2508 [Gammaproteobacteria bacterium]